MFRIALRYFAQYGVVSAEFQTLIWFGVTMVGVAALSGQFTQWQRLDQIAALCVLTGIGWPVFRTGGLTGLTCHTFLPSKGI